MSTSPCSRNPEAWFSEDPTVIEQAKRDCRPCPIRRTCLEGAIERRERCGVWGGELIEKGRITPRELPHRRPRK